jgi:hypothetical protein
MSNLNPFNVFSVSEIAAAINVIPNSYGRLEQLGLFPVKGVSTTQIATEEANGSLSLIPTSQYGAPGSVGAVGKRKVRTFTIPKLEYNEFATPQEVQNVRGFGGSEAMSLASLLADKLATARAKHDITLEWHRMGALNGQILDADGSTVLLNLFTDFGVTEKSVDFVLGTAGTKVSDKCREVVRHIEDNLLGEVMTRVHALVSAEFYDKLITHVNVEKAYQNWTAAQDRIGGDLRSGFTFGGITFEEYRGSATNSAGSTSRFIAANAGRAFPVGTVNTFKTFVGPADFIESANQLGQLYYAKTAVSKFERGYEIHTQSNPLPMCLRPAVLVKILSSN